MLNNLNASHVTVVDGDTIKLGDVKIRFSGIDAPEINQTCVASEGKVACGKISKDILIAKVTNNKISCTDEGKDFYGRVLGECFVNGESLSSYLVREGFAFAYRKYSQTNIYKTRNTPNSIILVCGPWNLNIPGIIEAIIKYFVKNISFRNNVHY